MSFDFQGIPAGDLFVRGLHDLRSDQPTAEAFLVAMASPRLVPLGLVRPEEIAKFRRDRVAQPDDFAACAYRLLQRAHGREAHARFLAASEELDSGLSALEREHRSHAAGYPT